MCKKKPKNKNKTKKEEERKNSYTVMKLVSTGVDVYMPLRYQGTPKF